MRLFNERNALEVTASFTAEDGTPVLPASVHWRLYCDTNAETVVDWTEAPVETLSDENGVTGYRTFVEIPSSANRIIDTANRRETRQLTIATGKDGEGESSETLEYYVARMPGR